MSCCSRRLQEWLQLAKGQLPSQVGPPIGTPHLSSSCGAVQESYYALLHLHLTGNAIGLQLAGCISTTMSADRVSQECTKHAPYPFGCPGIKHNTHAAGITRPCLRALKSALAVEAAAANTSQQQVTGHSSAATPMSALQPCGSSDQSWHCQVPGWTGAWLQAHAEGRGRGQAALIRPHAPHPPGEGRLRHLPWAGDVCFGLATCLRWV